MKIYWNNIQKYWIALKILSKNILMLKQSIMANNNQLKKPYEDEIRTDFHNNRMPPVKSACRTYSIILIDPVYKGDKGY